MTVIVYSISLYVLYSRDFLFAYKKQEDFFAKRFVCLVTLINMASASLSMDFVCPKLRRTQNEIRPNRALRIFFSVNHSVVISV